MTRRKVSFLQGTDPTRYQLPAEDHRLNHAGLWVPSTLAGAPALGVRSGVVAGPGNPAAVSVVGGGVNINPFMAVIQGSVTTTQGAYEVTSDAIEFRAITAASSTEFRRGRLVVRVYDTLNTGTKDDWDIEVVYGPNAATAGAAALPALPANSLELAQFAVSNTGVITLTGTIPWQVGRGGVLPVDATDTAAGAYRGQYRDTVARGPERWNGTAWEPTRIVPVTAGDVTAPAYDGQYRDHPTLGLQRGYGGQWGAPVRGIPGALIEGTALQSIPTGVATIVLLENVTRLRGFTYDTATGRLTCQTAGTYLVSAALAYTGNASGRRYAQLYKNGAVTTAGTHTELVAGTVNTFQLPTPTIPMVLAAGDYLQLGGLQDSGVALNIGRINAFLAAVYLWDV